MANSKKSSAKVQDCGSKSNNSGSAAKSSDSVSAKASSSKSARACSGKKSCKSDK